MSRNILMYLYDAKLLAYYTVFGNTIRFTFL